MPPTNPRSSALDAMLKAGFRPSDSFVARSDDRKYEIHFDFTADIPTQSWFYDGDIPRIFRYLAEHAPKHECRIIRRGNNKLGIKRRTVSVRAEKLGKINDGEIDSYLAAHFDEWVEADNHEPAKKFALQKQSNSKSRSGKIRDKGVVGNSRLTLQCRHRRHVRTIRHLASRYNISLKVIYDENGMIVFECDGSNLNQFCNHISGHRDCRSVRIRHLTSPVKSTGTDSKHRDYIENGLSDAPTRKRQKWQLAVRVLVPNTELPHWQCELCGVASDDPSTIVVPNSEAARSLSETLRERLLTMLWREIDCVKDVWEPLGRILQPSTRCDITETELVDLLKRAFHELDKDGIRIIWPDELISGKKSRVKKKCVVTEEDVPRKPGTLKKDVILRFQVDLAIDGEALSPDELQQMARIREPLVKVRGKWLYIDSELKGELEKVAQEVLDYSIRSISETEAVGMVLTNEVRDAAGADAIPADIVFDVEGLQESLDSFRSGEPPEIALPNGLDATLRPYQRHGLNWLAMLGDYGLGACLADDMGLGKTLQTLAWLQCRKESGITEPALLICPTSVITNWEKEARRFTPKLRVFRQHGPNRPDDKLKFFARARKESTDLVITSFGTMCQDLELFQSVSWKWSAVILDEAQNIKNPDTTQSKAARSLSKYAAARLALTGTPIENGPRDLWPIMEFLNPGMLGTWPAYVKNFASPIEHEKDTYHRAELQGKIQPFILRRKKTDPGIAPELPRKIEQTVWCSLTREQAGWYQASLNNMMAALGSKDKKDRQGAILKVLQELKQVCNGVAVLQKDRSQISSRAGKITQLISMLATVVENGEKAIVFSQYPSQFRELSELLMDRLTEHVKDTIGRPVGVLSLTGDDPLPEREVTQKRFAENVLVSVLLISLRAGGTGLNLQSANHVFHLDRWWNSAVEDQATDRAWRIGQKKVVHAHKFVCRGTLEERIDAMITKKRKLASALLGDADEDSVASQLAKLDADALYDVLRLDESEAVSDDDSDIENVDES